MKEQTVIHVATPEVSFDIVCDRDVAEARAKELLFETYGIVSMEILK